MKTEDLELIVRKYVILGKKSPKGYEAIKCASCNDYQERAGFSFFTNGFSYNCFNCGLKCVYDSTSYKISKKLKSLLLSYGIPESEIDNSVNSNFFSQKPKAIVEKSIDKNLFAPAQNLELPKGSNLVSSGTSEWCSVAEAYLNSRSLSSKDYSYYVTDNLYYSGRVIIPYYFREKLIYWQARSLDESIKPRYKNPVAEKDNVFFNMDELYRYTDDPLFVVEGPLDALSIGKQSIAILGSDLTEYKLQELKKVAKKRKVIFVIDKNKNGYKLGSSILDNDNFFITTFPDNIEDANDALVKLGKLWIINHLATSSVNGFAGKLLLKMNCK